MFHPSEFIVSGRGSCVPSRRRGEACAAFPAATVVAPPPDATMVAMLPIAAMLGKADTAFKAVGGSSIIFNLWVFLGERRAMGSVCVGFFSGRCPGVRSSEP